MLFRAFPLYTYNFYILEIIYFPTLMCLLLYPGLYAYRKVEP